jgi:hypothetical protein
MATIKCCQCDDLVDVPVTDEQLDDWYENRQTLPLIQDHFADLSDDDREMILSAICSKCWAKAFPDDEMDGLEVGVDI